MADNTAIQIEHVSKTFKLPHEKNSSIKGAFINFYKRKKGYEKQQVLKDISFEIKEGEFFGIVGRNGSGKSTLLKLLAGIYNPDEGLIKVNGKLTPFIELGVGFNPELSGRENVFLNGALLGFSRKEMTKMYDEIVEFAELERFMDQKLKNYSSGMQVRLAFSIAIRARTSILLLDEVLAVGDAIFQKKCYDYFKQLKRDKKTVIFVSHDTSALLEYCDKGILLEKGRITQTGPIDKIVNEYIDILNAAEADTDKKTVGPKNRWGNGDAAVVTAQTQASDGGKKGLFTDEDEAIVIEVSFKADKDLKSPVFGITIVDSAGQRVITSNTLWSRIATSDMRLGQSRIVKWIIPNAFNSGTYAIAPAIADQTGSVTLDWLEDAASFKVRKKIKSIAHININHEIIVS